MRLLLPTLLLVVLSWQTLAGDLEAVREKYEAQRKEIDTLLEADRKSVLGLYERGLAKLAQRYKANTDLDGLIAVREEISRFEDEQDLSALNTLDDIKDLAGLQKAILDRLGRAEDNQMLRLNKVLATYLVSLEETKGQLTRADKLDEALSVKEEIELVKASPEYDSIRQHREAQEAERQRRMEELKKRRAQIHQDSRPPAKLTRKTSFDSGIAVYQQGEEPLANMKRLAIDFTNRESRAASSKMTGSAGIISIKDSGSSSYPNRFIPRLTLATSNPEGYQDCKVLMEYFTKDRGSTRRRAFSEWISGVDFEPRRTLVVDGRGYRSKHYTGSSYSYLYFGYVSSSDRKPNTNYSTGSYSSYDDFGGIIFSVYDSSNQLLFQRSSQRALSDLAKPTFSGN